jgi:L-lysine exporter family protein LysE/ArgO
LIYIAYGLYVSKYDVLIEAEKDISRSDLLKAYTSGYLLTLLNPYTIAFWTSVSVFVVSKDEYRFLIIFGMITAILSWITIMPYIIHRTKHRLSQSFYSKVSLVAAFILFGFGVYLLYVTIAMILE